MEKARACASCQAEFRLDADSLAFYEKLGALPPGHCPECRFKRRGQLRNETALYARQCDLCQKSIISMYSPQSPYTVYCQPCWESDQWDPYAYAMDYDPARPFFDQLNELLLKVPKKGLYIGNAAGPSVNSEYTNVSGGNKNSYFIFNSAKNEDCLYSRGLSGCRSVADAYFGMQEENCYETVGAEECSGVVFGQNVTGCLDSAFIRDSNGCSSCFGCVNLRHKTHHFLNEPLSKEEYGKRVAEIRGSHSKTEEFRKKFEEFSLKFPRKENSNYKSENCVGNYIFESKNVEDGFEVSSSENSRHLFSVKFNKDSEGLMGYGWYSELLLECVAAGYSSRVIGCYAVENSHDIEYSFGITASEYCIGCDGIKKGQHVILNRRYSPEDYKALREKIVSELKASGDFGGPLPPALSPFGYNETVVYDNFPLSKEEALRQGFKWQDNLQMTTGKETLAADKIPDHIREVDDSILKETLACADCARNYRITPPELAFYRQMTLPIPRQCFYCRHRDRVRRRGPLTIYDRECGKCGKGIRTTYAPDRPEIVYCENCYNNEVV